MTTNFQSYRLQTGPSGMSKNLIRCSIFEALAMANGRDREDGFIFEKIWGKPYVDFLERDHFLRCFGYELVVYTNSKRKNESWWKILTGTILCSEKTLDILIEDTYCTRISIDDATCWIKNLSIIKHIDYNI